MDLNKVRKFEYHINFDISNHDIKLLNQGFRASKFFYDSQASLDIFPKFFQFSAKLSNGMLIQKSFWNFEILPIMTFNELNLWKPHAIYTYHSRLVYMKEMDQQINGRIF